MSDFVNDWRVSLGTVLQADATLITLMDRDRQLVVNDEDLRLDGELPIISLLAVSVNQKGNDGDSRDIRAQLNVIAKNPNAMTKAESILDRLERILLTGTALADATGFDSVVVDHNRRYPGVEVEGTRGMVRVEVEFLFACYKAAF